MKVQSPRSKVQGPVANDRCPKCGLKGKPRSGADFAGQMRCYQCRQIWRWVAANGYGHLP